MRRLTKDLQGSYDTASSQAKPRFSLTSRDGLIIHLGLVARIGDTVGTGMSPFVEGMSFRTGVAALSNAETWYAIVVSRCRYCLDDFS